MKTFRLCFEAYLLAMALFLSACGPRENAIIVEAQPPTLDPNGVPDEEELPPAYWENTVLPTVFPIYAPIAGEEFFCNYAPAPGAPYSGVALVEFRAEAYSPQPTGGIRTYFSGCAGRICGLQQADSMYTVIWEDGNVYAEQLGAGSEKMLIIDGQLSHDPELEFWLPGQTEMNEWDEEDPLDLWYSAHPGNNDPFIRDQLFNRFQAELYEPLEGGEWQWLGSVDCAATSAAPPLQATADNQNCHYCYNN